MDYVIVILTFVNTLVLIILLRLNYKSKKDLKATLHNALVNDLKESRGELNTGLKDNREELTQNISQFRENLWALLQQQNEMQKDSLSELHKMLEEKINNLTEKNDRNAEKNRTELQNSIKAFTEAFDKNVKSMNDLQREKFDTLAGKQKELVESTEKRLEQMRETVEEKLQQTLKERIGQSFETVGKQLQAVQEGLGEMKNLAGDVGGLKKVLNNVKTRGGMGEIQLSMLLEQVLAPQQYEANVKTKANSRDHVEFAIKLPGKENDRQEVWLPIDAKFPQDAFTNLQNAIDKGDAEQTDKMRKQLFTTLKNMAKSIHDKYINPPYTTDFGIMFLPFEGIYAEVIRHPALMNELQHKYNIVVTGPTTLAALLNSLQMGFRTLAIQKRSSEVWKVLGEVKTEFGKFGDLIRKARNNFHTGISQLDELSERRTRAIDRKLKDVETRTLPDHDH